jgi:hypothetical protein
MTLRSVARPFLAVLIAGSAFGQTVQLEAVKSEVAEDFRVFETCAYSAQFTVEEYAYLDLPKDVPDPLAAPGALARFRVPPKSSGLVRFAASGPNQTITIAPLSIATDHATRSFAKPFVIRGDAQSVTAVAADGSRGVRDPNQRASDARPQDLFTLCPRVFHEEVLTDARLKAPKPRSRPDIKVESSTGTRQVDNRADPESAVADGSEDITVLTELLSDQVRESNKPFRRAREVRYAADQGWRPRRVTFYITDGVKSVYDITWKQCAADGKERWFPIGVVLRAYDPTSSEAPAVRTLARKFSLSIDESSLTFDRAAVRATLDEPLPASSKIAMLPVRSATEDPRGLVSVNAEQPRPSSSRTRWRSPTYLFAIGTLLLVFGLGFYVKEKAKKRDTA